MTTQHLLFGSMLFSYMIPVLVIFWNYSGSNHNSISALFLQEHIRIIVLISMFAMGIFTLQYEYFRWCKLENEGNDGFPYEFGSPFIAVFFLLFGVFGCVLVDETNRIVHYSFAGIVYASILYFMGFFCIDFYFEYMYHIQWVLFVYTLFYFRTDIFWLEVLFLINFGLFYSYLHFQSNR
jgi:hypothetical protein